MFKAALSAVGGIFRAVGAWFDWRERKAHEKLGRLQEQVDQYDDIIEIERRMDRVEPSGRRDTAGRLRDGEF